MAIAWDLRLPFNWRVSLGSKRRLLLGPWLAQRAACCCGRQLMQYALSTGPKWTPLQAGQSSCYCSSGIMRMLEPRRLASCQVSREKQTRGENTIMHVTMIIDEAVEVEM